MYSNKLIPIILFKIYVTRRFSHNYCTSAYEFGSYIMYKGNHNYSLQYTRLNFVHGILKVDIYVSFLSQIAVMGPKQSYIPRQAKLDIFIATTFKNIIFIFHAHMYNAYIYNIYSYFLLLFVFTFA